MDMVIRWEYIRMATEANSLTKLTHTDVTHASSLIQYASFIWSKINWKWKVSNITSHKLGSLFQSTKRQNRVNL